jgi:hypothetical protein
LAYPLRPACPNSRRSLLDLRRCRDVVGHLVRWRIWLVHWSTLKVLRGFCSSWPKDVPPPTPSGFGRGDQHKRMIKPH